MYKCCKSGHCLPTSLKEASVILLLPEIQEINCHNWIRHTFTKFALSGSFKRLLLPLFQRQLSDYDADVWRPFSRHTHRGRCSFIGLSGWNFQWPDDSCTLFIGFVKFFLVLYCAVSYLLSILIFCSFLLDAIFLIESSVMFGDPSSDIDFTFLHFSNKFCTKQINEYNWFFC